MLCLNREEGENNLFFSGKKSEILPDFLQVHKRQSNGVASVS